MSFVEDNSLSNALRYARMMHGDSFLDQQDPVLASALQGPPSAACHWPDVVRSQALPTDPHLPWRNQQIYNSRLRKIEF